jgi:beta-lactamase class D
MMHLRELRTIHGALTGLAALVMALLPGALPALPSEPGGPEAAAAPAAGVAGFDLQRHLDAAGAEGCFLLYNAEGEPFIRLNPDRADLRYPPASTFKILNSLIALEAGVLKDEHEIIPWDGKKRWLDKWNQDMDLASAYALSAVWFYQEVARRVGLARMAELVSKTGYGNGEIGKVVDTFWLEGPLMISPGEQIGFLRRLYAGDLPFSERSLRIAKAIMLFERGEGYAVRAKTGWAIRNGLNTGWYIGWIEREGGPWYFALNIESDEKDFPMFAARRKILLGMLAELKLIPEERPRGSRL